MTFRIALSSSTGISVDEHFSKASSFYIYEIKGDVIGFLEKRIPRHSGGHCAESFDEKTGLIADCKAVFVSRIGTAAAEKLISKGIRVFEAAYPVNTVINEIKKGNPVLIDEGTKERI
jgi:predicted Fe-Mo cluster-binding NifX family protein